VAVFGRLAGSVVLVGLALAGCSSSSESSEPEVDSTISPMVLEDLCAEMVTDWTSDEYGEGRFQDAEAWCSIYVARISDARGFPAGP
jgi:hypothetical protein